MKIALHVSPHGKGVVATESIAAGELVLNFAGPIVHRSQLPVPYERVPDRYLQIDQELYLGASGDLDDFVNHSCDPNTGIRIDGSQVYLRALRPIVIGEEITYDYSTTMDEDDWEMDCACNASHCRKRVTDFKKLPPEIKSRYRQLGIVPQYVLDGDDDNV